MKRVFLVSCILVTLFVTPIIVYGQRPPVKAAFTESPSVGCELNHTVFFTDLSENPDVWLWNFGDGATSTSQNPIHTYNSAGSFNVSLFVQDTINGDSDVISRTITIGVATVDFNASGTFGCGPLTTNFTDLSSIVGEGSIVSWLWDFGDGKTSTEQNPVHTYNNSGQYSVSLTVGTSLGCTNVKTVNNFIQVIGPNVQFTTTSSTVLNGPGALTFQNQTTATSPITSWAWDFGDGATSNLQNPTHTFTTSGVFDVSLTVSDLDGCSRTLTKTNFVNTIYGAFDVSQAIFTGDHERFSVAAEAALPRSLAFNPDGTKMFVLDADNSFINEYSLSSAYDVSTAVFAGDSERFSVAGQENVPRSVAFSSNGKKMFVMGTIGDDINEYHLATAFDISTAVYAGDSERFSVAAQETHPTSLVFSPEGTKMYVAGSDDDEINEYTLSTAFDVSTATYRTTLSVSAQDLFPQSIAFVGNGLKLLVMGSAGDDINEYNLTTAFDISTASYAGDAERLSLAGQDNQPNSFAFNADGTQLYVLGVVGKDINVYSLASPVIIGAAANQAINDTSSIGLFSAIIVQEPNGDNVSATITLDDNAKGVVTGAGLSGMGPYTLASTDAASLQASLRGLVFSPTENRVATGGTETTTFTLVASDGTFSDTDSKTTVVSSPIAPTIVWSSLASSPTNAFNITATFSESMTGFTLGDLTVGNGTASNFVATNTSVYTATITPTADGIVTVDAGAGVAQDAGGADNVAATQFSITADITAPEVVISSLVADPTNAAFTVIFTFSEDVTGFEGSDISVVNGTIGTFTATNASVYTAEITPIADGPVSIDVAANVAEDVATNGNIAATQFSVEADFTAPTITISSSVVAPTNGAFTAIFTFSEDVTGFDITDIIVGNGTAGRFTSTSSSVYTAEITPTADGTVTVDVAANVAEDVATNGNIAAAPFSVLYDDTDPTVTISSSLSVSTKVNPIPVTITFSEEVTDFTVSDITVGNGSVANFITSDNRVFTADIIPNVDGNVTVDIPSAIALDLAGNNNEEASTFTIVYDSKVDQVICQNLTVQLDANGTATIQVDQIDNASSDSFGIASRSIDVAVFNCNDVGDNTVALTIIDNNGNVGTCVAIVTVVDVIAPNVLTQDITVALDANGQATISPDDIDNGSTDNCGIATLSLDIDSFDSPNTEWTTVSLKATDFNGNSASSTAIVTFGKVGQNIVFDPIPDKKVGQNPVLLQATGGGSGLPVIFSIVTEPASGVASLLNGNVIIEGPGLVTITANQAGNDVFMPAEEVTQTFEILSNELFLPTLFTPNSDQTNDRFILRGGGNVANIDFRIFDRNGNSVFISQSINELSQSGWDGTSGDEEQPQGAYIWVIKGSFEDGSPLLINGKNTGVVNLVR